MSGLSVCYTLRMKREKKYPHLKLVRILKIILRIKHLEHRKWSITVYFVLGTGNTEEKAWSVPLKRKMPN